MSMVWFVTGASSGIGAGAVKAALAASDRMVAIARNTDKLTKAVGKESESLVHAALDVRNAGQVREAVATALESGPTTRTRASFQTISIRRWDVG